MFCEKCGTKNKPESKFCEKCGQKLTIPKKSNYFKNLSLKNKVLYTSLTFIIVIILSASYIYLNNPDRLINKYLDNYYETKELKNLSKLENLLNKELHNSKYPEYTEKVSRKMEEWINLFNREYQNLTALETNYLSTTKEPIETIYENFNHNEIVITSSKYHELLTELTNLYNSKTNYLNGLLSLESDKSKTYSLYQKVIEEDCYYTYSKKFINEFLKESTSKLTEELETLITTTNESEPKEIINNYIKVLEFLNNNKEYEEVDISHTDVYIDAYNNAQNNIISNLQKLNEIDNDETISKEESLNKYLDLVTYNNEILSNNSLGLNEKEEIKKIKDETNNKILEYTKLVCDEKLKYYDYENAVNTINKTKKYLTDKDLENLNIYEKEVEKKKPLPLASTPTIDNTYSATAKSTSCKIDGETFKNCLNFGLNGENQYLTFNLEKKYTRLKGEILKPSYLKNGINGKIIIYADNKEIYRSPSIHNKIENNVAIDLDVTSVNELKIVLDSKTNSRDFVGVKHLYLTNIFVHP